MKTSLLIAAIILGIGALFVVQRQNEIRTLTTEWTGLENQAQELNVPIDSDTPFRSDRLGGDKNRALRTGMVADLARELIAAHQVEAETGFEAIQDSLAKLSPEELRLFVKEILADTTIEDQSKSLLFCFLISGLADDSNNPEAALAITVQVWDSFDEIGVIINSVLGECAEKDPVAAAQWLIDHREKVSKIDEHSKIAIIQSAARKDLGAALSFLDSFNAEKNPSAIFGLAFGVNSENADVFLATIRERATDPTLRKTAFNGLVASNLMENFENGTTWLEKSNFTDDERKDLFSFLPEFARRDQPGKWLNWIADQEQIEESIPSNTTETIIQQWTKENFAATGEWINNQQKGPQKEAAIQTYAKTIAPQEPAAAADWATTLPEGQDRTKLLQTIHTSLKEKDPAAATALAEKHQLKID